MGLDNGIRVKHPSQELIDALPSINEKRGLHLKVEYEEIELAYWRKCWNIRSAIYGILLKNGDIVESPNMGDAWCDDISIESLEDIAKFLRHIDKEWWEENSDSIWTWQEAKKWFPEDIRSIKAIIAFKKEHPETLVNFYDSY